MRADLATSNSAETVVMRSRPGGRWKREVVRDGVRLTDQTLSCAARARVPKPQRHDTRLHVRSAMRVACRRDDLDCASRLGRRTEAGPRQLLRRVRPPSSFSCTATDKKRMSHFVVAERSFMCRRSKISQPRPRVFIDLRSSFLEGRGEVIRLMRDHFW